MGPGDSVSPTQSFLGRSTSALVRSVARAARRLKSGMPLVYPGWHRRLKPLSFAYFSLRLQRKVGAAPHRGNANRPKAKSGCQRKRKRVPLTALRADTPWYADKARRGAKQHL